MRVTGASFLLLAGILGCATSRESPDIARARGLIERLRSFDIEERDEAMAELERMGEKAESALREAVEDADPDVGARARSTLRRSEIFRSISTRLRKEQPGIVEKLVCGDPNEWTAAFMKVCEERGHHVMPGGWREVDYSDPDLRFLAQRAILGLQDDDEGWAVIKVIGGSDFRHCWAEVLGLMTHEDWTLSSGAAFALRKWKVKACVPGLLELLHHPVNQVRRLTIYILQILYSVDLAPSIADLLDDPEPEFRKSGMWFLVRGGGRWYEDRIAHLLMDKNASVRSTAEVVLKLIRKKHK